MLATVGSGAAAAQGGTVADGGTELQVLGTSPQSPAILEAGEKVTVMIRYQCVTAETVRIWAMPYSAGVRTPHCFWEPSKAEQKGTGDVERFVGVFAPGEVDEIRVSMVDADTETQLAENRFSVTLTWRGILFGRVNPIGLPFPNLSFTSMQDERIDLAKLRGRAIIVHAWRTSQPFEPGDGGVSDLVAMYDKYHPNGLEIVGINLDWEPMTSESAVRAYIRKKKMRWPQHYDGQGPASNEIAKQFGAIDLDSYLIDRKGIVRLKFRRIDRESLERAITEILAEDTASQ